VEIPGILDVGKHSGILLMMITENALSYKCVTFVALFKVRSMVRYFWLFKLDFYYLFISLFWNWKYI